MKVPKFAGRSMLAAAIFLGGVASAHAANIDLAINHNAIPSSATGPARGDFTYQPVVFINTTGVTASGVKLTQVLPVGVVLKEIKIGETTTWCDVDTGGVSPVPSVEITSSNNTIVCDVPDIVAAGVENGIPVSFKVMIPEVGTNWLATAAANLAGNTDPDPTNHLNIKRNITTTNAADVALSVTTDPACDFSPVPDGDSCKIKTGETYTQTIKVTNNGPTNIPSAGRVEVGFAVPVGASVSGFSGSGWSCLPSAPVLEGTQVVCSHPGALESGQAVVNDLVIYGVPNIVDGSVTTQYSVQAYSSSSDNQMPDGQPDNNTGNGTIQTGSVRGADLTITKKRDGNATVPVGNEVTYTVTPRFLGGKLVPGDQIKVVDTVGTGLGFESMTSTDTNWVCDSNECIYTVPNPAPNNFTDLPALKVTATVKSEGELENEAEVIAESGFEDPNLGNNKSSAKVTGSNSADLRMIKTADNYKQGVNVAVPVGTPYKYSLNVYNGGPLSVPAAGGVHPAITITDTPDAGIVIEGIAQANGWTCSDNPFPFTGNGSASFSCSYAAGVGNKGTTPALILNAKRTTEGNAENSACTAFGTVTGEPSRKDPNNTNNCDGVKVGASNTSPENPNGVNEADLRITKTASGPVYAGKNLTYTFVIENLGPKAAQDVTLIDNLGSLVTSPHGPSLVAITGLESGQSCTPNVGSTASSHDLKCNLGTLANGAVQEIKVTVRPNVKEVGEQRENTVYVYSATTYDPNSSNNESTTDSKVTARVDLKASKVVATSVGGDAAGEKEAAAGSLMRYTVRASNAGPSSAENVWLRDTLPAEAILVGELDLPSGGTCQVVAAATADADAAPVMGGGTLQPEGEPGGVLECVWGNDTTPAFLAADGQREINYNMRSVPAAPGETAAGKVLENTVVVGTKTYEENLENNSAEAVVTLIKEELDVLINMDHTADGFVLGGETEYRITVTNNGPSFATNVTMTDVFPGVYTNNGDESPSTAVFSFEGLISVVSNKGGDLGFGDCTAPTNGTSAELSPALPLQLQCVFPVLAPEETVTIKFKMKAVDLPEGFDVGTIFHNANVETDEVEWLSNGSDVEANNTTADRTSTRRYENTPQPEFADLELKKVASVRAGDDPLQSGEALTYTLTVINHGPADSTNAVVTDVLPPGLDFASASAGCELDVDTRTVSCAVGNLAKGAEKELSINTIISEPYKGPVPLRNSACVKGLGDPNPDNDCDSDETPVVPPLKPAPVPVDNPLALLALILGMGWTARRFHMRKHA